MAEFQTDFLVERQSKTLQNFGKDKDEDILAKADISPEELTRIQGNVNKLTEQGQSFGQVVSYLGFEGISPNIDTTPKQLSDEQQIGLNIANFAKGSIEGTFNLASLPFMLTDAFVGGIKKVFTAGESEFQLPASGAIQGFGALFQ